MPQLVGPPGWPSQVRPPGAPDWEATATAWLLDLGPPEYRTYPVLRRHAVVLAGFVARHIEAGQAAARQGLAEVRTSLRDQVQPETVEDAARAWSAELARLDQLGRAVALVQEALRGRRFRPRL